MKLFFFYICSITFYHLFGHILINHFRINLINKWFSCFFLKHILMAMILIFLIIHIWEASLIIKIIIWWRLLIIGSSIYLSNKINNLFISSIWRVLCYLWLIFINWIHWLSNKRLETHFIILLCRIIKCRIKFTTTNHDTACFWKLIALL